MLSKKLFSILIITILLFICFFGTEASATNIVAMNISNSSGNKANISNAAGINITSTGGKNNTSNKANNTTNNATNNTVEETTNNTNVNNNTANKNKNVSSYNNSNKNASGLPYTGTSDSMLFIVAALILSAIYAYKKIRDYNV